MELGGTSPRHHLANRDLIAMFQFAFLHRDAVYQGAVATAQITDRDCVIRAAKNAVTS